MELVLIFVGLFIGAFIWTFWYEPIVRGVVTAYDWLANWFLAPLRLWKQVKEERGKRALQRRFSGFFLDIERRRQVKNDPLEG